MFVTICNRKKSIRVRDPKTKIVYQFAVTDDVLQARDYENWLRILFFNLKALEQAYKLYEETCKVDAQSTSSTNRGYFGHVKSLFSISSLKRKWKMLRSISISDVLISIVGVFKTNNEQQEVKRYAGVKNSKPVPAYNTSTVSEPQPAPLHYPNLDREQLSPICKTTQKSSSRTKGKSYVRRYSVAATEKSTVCRFSQCLFYSFCSPKVDVRLKSEEEPLLPTTVHNCRF